jgi:hypothetical protein
VDSYILYEKFSLQKFNVDHICTSAMSSSENKMYVCCRSLIINDVFGWNIVSRALGVDRQADGLEYVVCPKRNRTC